MERLTIETKYGWQLANANLSVSGDVNVFNKAMDTLAAYESSKLSPERAAELGEADKDGRLVILPFAKGNVLYRIAGDEILEECVRDIVFRAVGDWSLYAHFNKTVFTTQEEAENALKEAQK